MTFEKKLESWNLVVVLGHKGLSLVKQGQRYGIGWSSSSSQHMSMIRNLSKDLGHSIESSQDCADHLFPTDGLLKQDIKIRLLKPFDNRGGYREFLIKALEYLENN